MVVLLEVKIRGTEYIALVEVEVHEFALSVFLADQENTLAVGVICEIAGHPNRLEEIYFFGAAGKGAAVAHFSGNGETEIQQPDIHDGFGDIIRGPYIQGIAELTGSESGRFYGTDHREIDISVSIDEVRQRRLAGGAGGSTAIGADGHHIKRRTGHRIDGLHGYREQIVGLEVQGLVLE